MEEQWKVVLCLKEAKHVFQGRKNWNGTHTYWNTGFCCFFSRVVVVISRWKCLVIVKIFPGRTRKQENSAKPSFATDQLTYAFDWTNR
ncbi:hypothetical protein AVEN_225808-1 [Araneus ventricosus]|uniref:Uncharacterized protein n=1 Tax=Araneus ventricosus TaxID=182803 RepID=A0A4Y2BDR5_ARAVE|nr:hypothetical protein AVEN_225808-1 [Araneus ventricosus]